MKVSSKTKKVYQVIMSKGDNIKVDDSEIEKVIQSVQSGNPCRLKQAIINPSFLVSIVPDKERQYEINKYGEDRLDDAFPSIPDNNPKQIVEFTKQYE